MNTAGVLKTVFVVSSVLLSANGPALAETEIRSGPEKVALVELFTSQGCSSCPPADQWMSSLLDRSRLWRSYVPLAFHVDYWDYIGWQDPFANAEFSDRQRQYARQGDTVTVYTPGFVLDGREWRRWRSSSEPVTELTIAGELSATVDRGRALVRYAPESRIGRHLVAYVALLGFGLTSDVSSGENAGRRLRNDFVVLGLEHATMTGRGDLHLADVDIPAGRADVDRLAVAVWISEDRALAPLQSAGGWIDRGDLWRVST